MKRLLLTNRYMFALIDDEDFDRVSRYKWQASSGLGGKNLYVRATQTVFPKTHQTLHRFVLKANADQIIDHINGNVLDNRRQNLRFVTAAENSENKHSEAERIVLRREDCFIPRGHKNERSAESMRSKDWQRRPDQDMHTASGCYVAYEKHGIVFHAPISSNSARALHRTVMR